MSDLNRNDIKIVLEKLESQITTLTNDLQKEMKAHGNVAYKLEQLTNEKKQLEEKWDNSLLSTYEERITFLELENNKLKEDYKELDKQCAIERETANGLDYTCENYEKQLEQYKTLVDEQQFTLKQGKILMDSYIDTIEKQNTLVSEIESLTESKFNEYTIAIKLERILQKYKESK